MSNQPENFRKVTVHYENQPVELTLRPIRPSDAPALQVHHSRLSSDSVFYRFHGFKKELSEQEARTMSTLDGQSQAAVVAVRLNVESGEPQLDEIEGIARYYLIEPGVAEMAIVVRDAYQGFGLGQYLLEELILIARRNNIDFLEALVLADNWHMRHLLQNLDYVLTSKMAGPVVSVRIHINEPVTISAS